MIRGRNGLLISDALRVNTRIYCQKDCLDTDTVLFRKSLDFGHVGDQPWPVVVLDTPKGKACPRTTCRATLRTQILLPELSTLVSGRPPSLKGDETRQRRIDWRYNLGAVAEACKGRHHSRKAHCIVQGMMDVKHDESTLKCLAGVECCRNNTKSEAVFEPSFTVRNILMPNDRLLAWFHDRL